jgi:putative transcriptional regulator
MDVKKIRSMTGLSQSKFAAKYGIPLRTIQSWESNGVKSKRTCPEHVYEMLKKQVEMDFNKQAQLQTMYDLTQKLSADDITAILKNENDPNAKLFYEMLGEYLKAKKDG